MARAPIISRAQVIAEIETIYKSQGVKEMKLLRHAKALDKQLNLERMQNKANNLEAL